jgi:competence protein CoiA
MALANSTRRRGCDVERSDGPFTCPVCKGLVIVKKGAFKIHHFAHVPPYICKYGEGETEEHRLTKIGIYEALLNRGIQAYLEPTLTGCRPDVLADIGGPVAIEVQASCLPLDELAARTYHYHSVYGTAVFWLSTHKDALYDKLFSPKQYEKYLHALYFGKVYYWEKGLEILPVKYEDYMLYVEGSDYTERMGIMGDYWKRSKRWRKPKFNPVVNLVSDFRAIRRNGWQGGKYIIPECTIWSVP